MRTLSARVAGVPRRALLEPAGRAAAASAAASGCSGASAAALPHHAAAGACPALPRLPRRAFSGASGGGGGGGKVIPFNLPDIGEGIAEVEVLKWHVKEGDTVAQFDKLLEVQSDKATVDITSRYDGVVVKLYTAVGEMAKTGKPLLDIRLAAPTSATLPSQQAAAAAAAPAPATPATPAASAALQDGNRGLAAPSVRHIARQHGLSLVNMAGTGKDGRVTKEDIMKVVAGGGNGAASGSNGAAAPPARAAAAAPTPAPAPPAPRAPSAAPGGLPADTRVPIRGLQRIMVKSMTAAWDVPHFGYCDEVVMDALMALRGALRPAAEAAGVPKLTFLPLLLKAASLALTQFPTLNAQLSADASELILRGPHNIGVAMDTPRGLIVPSVKGVQALSVLEIAAELARLQALAAAGKLGEAELGDTTFR